MKTLHQISLKATSTLPTFHINSIAMNIILFSQTARFRDKPLFFYWIAFSLPGKEINSGWGEGGRIWEVGVEKRRRTAGEGREDRQRLHQPLFLPCSQLLQSFSGFKVNNLRLLKKKKAGMHPWAIPTWGSLDNRIDVLQYLINIKCLFHSFFLFALESIIG